MTEKKHSVKKLIVLLFLAFFLFGYENSSGDFEGDFESYFESYVKEGNLPKSCTGYMRRCLTRKMLDCLKQKPNDYDYCLKQKPNDYDYCKDIATSYLNCWDACKEVKLPDNFCKKACSCNFRWKYFGINTSGVYFYDPEDITWSSGRVAKVWWKTIYTKEGKERMARGLGKKYKEPGKEVEEKYKKIIGYDLDLDEINCATKEFHPLEVSHYSSDGVPVEGATFLGLFTDWEPIIPDTVMEILFNEVCSKKNK